RVLVAQGIKPHTVLESDLGASVCSLVAAGLGVSVINPLAALEEQRHLAMEVRPFMPSITIRLAILLPPGASHSRLTVTFIDHVRHAIESELQHISRYRR